MTTTRYRPTLPLCCLILSLPFGGQADPNLAAAQAEDVQVDVDSVVALLEFVVDADEDTARKCLGILTDKIQSREIQGARLAAIRSQLAELVQGIRSTGAEHPLSLDVTLLAASWGDAKAIASARAIVLEPGSAEQQRRRALDAVAVSTGAELLALAAQLVADDTHSTDFRGYVLATLGRLDQPQVATEVVDRYAELPAVLQPKAIELLTQRPAWSKRLLAAIGRNEIPPTALNVNQVAKLLASRDPELVSLVQAKWGSVRTERNPQREQVIREMRERLHNSSGDAARGQQVFQKVCGQCHQIHGVGQQVGPDITRNGRGSFDQLLSNVFDPSLVIGAAYQARTVITADGRILTGLLAEDSQQRIVLKVQGGKLETIPRDAVDELQVSQLSLMPEGLETQLQPNELADLFAFLTLDRPPGDPEATRIPGAPQQ